MRKKEAEDYKKHVKIDPRYFRPAEVDELLGDPSKAKKQLNYARKLARGDYVATATITERLREVEELHQRMEEL